MIVHSTNVSALQRQLKALYDWVGERKDKKMISAYRQTTEYTRGSERGGQLAYGRMKVKMQTLFAGLIDFESTGETDGERLPEDV